MRRFLRLFRLLVRDDGATAVEYSVMLVLVLMAVLASIGSLGTKTGGLWGGISTELQEVGFMPEE